MNAPGTPKTKASPEKSTPAKSGLVLGKGPGPINNAKIKDKIAKWQAAGGGAVMVDDPLTGHETEAAKSPKPSEDKNKVNEDNPEGDNAQDKDKAKAAKTKADAAVLGAAAELVFRPPRKQQPPSPQKPKANDLDEDVQAAVTPKKRVISDGHWRKNRSPPKENKPNAWVRPAAKKVVPPKPAEEAEKMAESPKKKDPPKLLPKPIYGPDGTRVQAVRKRRKSSTSKSSEEEPPRPEEDTKLKEEKPYEPPSASSRVKDALRRYENHGRAEDGFPEKKRSVRKAKSTLDDGEKHRDDSPVKIISRDAASEDELRRRRKSRRRPVSESKEALSSLPPEDSPVTEQRRSRRHRYSSPEHDDKASPAQSAPDTPETPHVFGNRVEAWLSGTPDPFLDGKKPRRSSSSTEGSIAAPVTKELKKSDDEHSSRHGSRRRRRRQSYEDHDEAAVSDDRQARRRSTTPVRDDVVVVEYESSNVSAPSLQRRGARRSKSESPTKRTPRPPQPATIPEDDIGPPVLSPRPRRPFPSTGKQLSTIASVMTSDSKSESLSRKVSQASDGTIGPDDAPLEETPSEGGRDVDTESVMTAKGRKNSVRRSESSKRRLASHADLMSVLSMPERMASRSKSIVSARSIRTNRSRLATATVDDLMEELKSDETKYMRELRTLVDGVIPVLLTCVLSKSESAVAAGLFSKAGSKDDSKITKPIVDMGVALERLKSLHKRIPTQDPEALLSWAQTAQKTYSDYVRSWRLGFQDVVVNLAPASDREDEGEKTANAPADASLDEGLPRNAEGYVVNGDGERVDVAFLLKRPLVRLKYLAKTFRGINILKPSDRANDMATRYQALVNDARRRSNEERARIEDEAAANIDPTRARDPRSLAPLAGVSIDPARCVRARDYFDMHLMHSSGQEVDCRIELLLRDDPPGRGNSGDLLLCEVDNNGRWLFFPPIQHSRLSARNGEQKGEIIVMIRGYTSSGNEWHELLTLRIDDEEAGFEWVHMLGLTPVPPKVQRAQSFISKPPRPTSSHGSSSLLSVGTESTPLLKSRTPSPREIEVPIGEQANPSSKKWGSDTLDRQRALSSDTILSSPPSSVDIDRSETVRRNHRASTMSPLSPEFAEDFARRKRHTIDVSSMQSSSAFTDAMSMTDSGGSPTKLKRSKAKRYSRDDPRVNRPSREGSPITPTRPSLQSEQSYMTTSSVYSQESQSTEKSKGAYSVWYPPSDVEEEDLSDYSDEYDAPISRKPSRPQAHRRTSSVPSMDFPTVTRLRKSSQPETPYKEETSQPQPSSAPAKLQKKRRPSDIVLEDPEETEKDTPPAPPPHRISSPVQLENSPTPKLNPPMPGFKTHRRTSSPLKHEYRPSACSDSSGESELSPSDYSESEGSIYSESSESEPEDDEMTTPIQPVDEASNFPTASSPPESLYSPPGDTLSPSQSASQAPFRRVPSTNAKPQKTVAMLYRWSDKGMWETLYPDECSIVITPGLIEAFEMSPSHSDSTERPEGEQPLVALELTPLVPLRRGTALDISIRSPPTPNSKIRTGDNVMFRSRSPEECEALYGLINNSRINNPTYIALQNARGPSYGGGWAEAMDRRNEARTAPSATGGGSWWGSLGRKNSYRASSTRALSTSADTASSSRTMQSAFSALKRFSGGNKLFNIGKSSISQSYDSGSHSTDSLHGEAEASPDASTPATQKELDAAAASIANTKVRLYMRESQTKWRDMGSGRLSIMRPSRPNTPNQNPYVRQGQGSPGQSSLEHQKRIVVLGKTKAETLLDVTLNESCFERVARTGIAVSVWEDVVGTNGEIGGVPAVGGVGGAKARVFMIQMKTERECAYCFSLLGKLRY